MKRWQDLEERTTPLAEASLARLRLAIDNWVTQPPIKADAGAVLALRDWQLGRAEHPVSEVAEWLDHIAAIAHGPLEFAISGETHVGATLDAARQSALQFGPAAETGLRAAWSRYPVRETYVVGDVVHSSLVIQNASKQTIEFHCPYSLDDIVSWNATADGGRKITTKRVSYRGAVPILTWRLKPGEVAEIGGGSAAIGEGERREEVHVASSTVLLAKRGEQVIVEWNVREPVAMTTGAVTFKVVGLEDVSVWSTSQAGRWTMPGGVTMEVKQELVHATDVMSTAILTWPIDKSGGTARHRIWLGGDAFAAREPWMLAWERGQRVLWTMSGQMQSSQDFHKVTPTPRTFRRIDFSNPEKITETSWSGVPDFVPDAIRAEFAKGFRPYAATPGKLASTNPSVQESRAEDVRPVSELLRGDWKSMKGYMDVRITFPQRATDQVKWTMTFERPQGNATVSDSLTLADESQDGSVRLIKNYTSAERIQSRALLGRLKRGIGDTLLLDTMAHVDFPEYQDTFGIVLVRAAATDAGQQPIAAEPKQGAKLQPGTEQRLQWGEPVNGLRMALIRPPAVGEPETHEVFDFRLVVQNVSDAPVRFSTAAAAEKMPSLKVRKDGRTLAAFSDSKPAPTDYLLQPREVAVLRLFSKRIEGTSITADDPALTFVVELETAAADDAWSGKLVSADTASMLSAYGLLPKNKVAQTLFSTWTNAARADGKIPGACIGPLADSVTTFTEYNPTWGTTPKLLQMLPRFDETRDWSGPDALALLDELAELQDTPIKMAVDEEYERTIQTGVPLPPELANSPWGETLPNGLRMAWRLEPQAAEHRLGTPLKSRILIHNAGKDSVVFRTRTWHQSAAHKARDANGADINISSTDWTTRGRLVPFRLAPGEFVEVVGAGIGVGPMGNSEDWQNTRVGSWMEAKAGDEVTFTPAAVPLNDWNETVERPGVSAERPGVSAWAGPLTSGPTTFRVLPADPDAAKRPRTATGPGRYTLRENVRLEVTRRPVGERLVNEAHISLSAASKQYEIKLPNGYDTWVAAWVRGGSVLWVRQKDGVRRYDFTNPAQLTEEAADPGRLPKEIREAIGAALDQPGSRQRARTNRRKVPLQS